MKRVDHLQDESFFNDMKFEKEIKKEYDGSIPFFVNECVYQMSVPVAALLEEGDDFYEVLRQHLNTRGKCFERALDELLFKYSLANAAESIINEQRAPFVLYLQEFSEKCFTYEHGTMIQAENYSGIANIIKAAAKYPKIVFVYIGVPFDSASLDYICLNLISGNHTNVLRVDCNKDWLETVKKYIQEASCILVDVKNLGKGTKKEIDFIKENGYLSKTCFLTDNVQLVLGYTGKNVILTDENYQDVGLIFENNKTVRTNTNLAVSSLWINGKIRQELVSNLNNFEQECVEAYKNKKKERAVIQLDNYFMALGTSIALEDFSRITSFLYPIINIIRLYSSRLLKNRRKQIFSYLSYFNLFVHVLEKFENYEPSMYNNKIFVEKLHKVGFIKKVIF